MDVACVACGQTMSVLVAVQMSPGLVRAAARNGMTFRTELGPVDEDTYFCPACAPRVARSASRAPRTDRDATDSWSGRMGGLILIGVVLILTGCNYWFLSDLDRNPGLGMVLTAAGVAAILIGGRWFVRSSWRDTEPADEPTCARCGSGVITEDVWQAEHGGVRTELGDGLTARAWRGTDRDRVGIECGDCGNRYCMKCAIGNAARRGDGRACLSCGGLLRPYAPT